MTASIHNLKRSLRQQQGVVLFFALMALAVISIAALTLVRAVDTNTLIAGNLAFRQAATASANSGVETALAAISTVSQAATTSAFDDALHPLNADGSSVGYYSWVNLALDLFADSTWQAGNSVLVGTDASGNTVRYIVQRMCRAANELLDASRCLFGGTSEYMGSQAQAEVGKTCIGAGCANGGPQVLYRVTARVSGPKNTVSYVQAFVY